MKRATVFFKSDERDIASTALRALGLTVVQGGGYVFDAVEHDDSKWVTLTRGLDTYVVPRRNILLIKIAHEDGVTS